MRSAMHAREAEQRKNDLIVYLAHDLKTPLTSIIGYLTLLRDEPELSPAMRAKYTGIALDKAERLETLINEFFEITRFSLTHLTLQREEVNLTRMLEQVTFEFQPVLAEMDLVWDLSLPPDVVVVCDPDKLERVFDNLLRNANNYSYPGTLIRVGQLFGGSSHLVQVVQGLGNIMIGQHEHPHQNQGASPQNHGGLHGFQKPVQRVLRLPDEQPAENPCQEDEQGEPRQHPQNA